MLKNNEKTQISPDSIDTRKQLSHKKLGMGGEFCCPRGSRLYQIKNQKISVQTKARVRPTTPREVVMASTFPRGRFL